MNVLVGKRSDGITMVMGREDQNYGSDKIATLQTALDDRLVRSGLEAGSVTVVSAATCDSELLDIDGTDLDSDITIVDNGVINAKG